MKQLGGKLRQFFKEHQEAYSVNQLAEIFHAQDSLSFKNLVQILAELERKAEIRLTKKGLFQTCSMGDSKGIFRQNERGFGFVTVEGEEEDIFISRDDTGLAMNGDEVRVELTSQGDPFLGKGPEGRVVEIVKRNYRRIIGTYQSLNKKIKGKNYIGLVVPRQKIWKDYKCYVLPGGIKAADQMLVSLEITDYPSQLEPRQLKGIISETLGHVDAPGTDILEILVEKGIPTEFPEDVKREAQEVPDEINEEDLKGREDDRDQLVMTIDGADAKDLDDAVSLTRLGNGDYCLRVYIADVSYYVREHTALDREALNRGTSVYVTDRVVPMLPQRLSNGICSLHPHVDRLVMACEMRLNEKGQRLSYRLYPTVINSSYRMTYSAVNQILSGDKDLRDDYNEIVPMLEDMQKLSRLLIDKRQKRGAIDFNAEEAEIKLDEKGFPIEIVKRQRDKAERLIESFMLLANETVAYHFNRKGLPFIYRIHEKPAADRIEKFREFIQAFGLSIEANDENISPKDLQAILKKAEGEPFEAMVSSMMLRAMKQARYTNEAKGHFGLASEDYTHFTSPIRRYPDLLVHRLIRQYGFMEEPHLSEEMMTKTSDQLEAMADSCSKNERRAVEAERESDAMKKAEFMQNHVGEAFDGVISSVTSFGFFVELDNTIEGLVRLASLSGDYYHFIENHMLLIGERTGQQFHIGDRVRIEVTRADKATREIDFELIDNYDQLQARRSVVDRSSRHKAKKDKRKNKGKKATRGKGENKPAQDSFRKGRSKGKRKGINSSKNATENKGIASSSFHFSSKESADSDSQLIEGLGFIQRKRQNKKAKKKSKKHLEFIQDNKSKKKKRGRKAEKKRQASPHARRTPK